MAKAKAECLEAQKQMEKDYEMKLENVSHQLRSSHSRCEVMEVELCDLKKEVRDREVS